MKTSISINDQDIAVAKFLEDNNVVYKSVYLLDCSKDSEWQHDLFNISFIKGSNLINTEFKTGLGHRVLKTKQGTYTSLSTLSTKYNKELKKANIEKGLHLIDNDFKLSNGYKNTFYTGGSCYAVSPTAASVLYSLLLDSDCGHELFEDFCNNCGYDQDSIKSLEIYRACQKNAKQLNSLFTQKQLEELRELLEDY
tara:strand:+ start:93478 stop:94065 length:588 start_codon:yes stop_codon:yes gene_type:complete